LGRSTRYSPSLNTLVRISSYCPTPSYCPIQAISASIPPKDEQTNCSLPVTRFTSAATLSQGNSFTHHSRKCSYCADNGYHGSSPATEKGTGGDQRLRSELLQQRLRLFQIALACGVSIYYDRDIRRVGQHVIDCRSLLRLRNESFNVFAFRIGVDLEGNLDAAEAIAHVVVYRYTPRCG
jgi:hypothetical protein